MTDPIEQFITQSREIGMTVTEKAALRHILQVHAQQNDARPKIAVVAGWFSRHAVLATALAFVLVLGGTGVSASMAGPTDVLYGFRIGVNDRVEAALALNDDTQINIQVRQIERQLIEEEDTGEELTDWDEEFADSTDDLDEIEEEVRALERALRDEESAEADLEM